MQRVLASAVGAGFLLVGVGALVAPRRLAAIFGLPSEDATALAWVRAACARDLLFGGLVLGSLDDRRALRKVLGWGSLVGLGDALLIVTARGIRPQLALHLGGFVAVAALALAMRPDEPQADAAEENQSAAS
jgi:peptidoglycan/LPS O-acetylase OafA/YrhL